MIDYIKVYQQKYHERILPFNPEPTEYLGFVFNPQYNLKNEVKSFIHKNEELGFVLKIFPFRLQFEGSLHKLYNRLNGKKGNHTDFTFSNLQYMVSWLENLFDTSLLNLKVSYLEFGVNLPLTFQFELYAEKFKSFQKKKSFYPMTKGNIIYGKMCPLSQFKVKFYNKTFESKVHQDIHTDRNLARFELVYSRMQSLKKYIKTIDDLNRKEVFNHLGKVLIKRFEQINYSNDVFDCSIIKSDRRQLYYAGQHPNFWLDEKLANPNNQHNVRAKFNRIEKNLKEESTKNFSNLQNELLQKMNSKIEMLKSNK